MGPRGGADEGAIRTTPIAVADAVPEIRAAAAFSAKNRGGKGAVREICEAILKAKGLWPYSIGKNGKLDFTP